MGNPDISKRIIQAAATASSHWLSEMIVCDTGSSKRSGHAATGGKHDVSTLISKTAILIESARNT